MKTNCPICNKTSRFDDEKAGEMITCPECDNLFVLKEGERPLKCPDCENDVSPDTRICIECGYSFDTGKKVEDHIPVYGEEFTPGRKALDFIVDFIPGLFKIHILALYFCSIFLAFLIMYFGLVLLGLGALFTCIFFGVMALVVYVHGCGCLMTGEVQMLRSAMAELTGNRWNFFLVLSFGPPITIFLIIFYCIKIMTQT